ncbi:nucleoside monophosphate kinase [Candidatus Babeliales bacterium]|nr:nucleoside monophosphate kinase [Candidatus Babeliales bacterium]
MKNLQCFFILFLSLSTLQQRFCLQAYGPENQLKKLEKETTTIKQEIPNVIITFLGAPGSGKGTLAQLCAQRLDFKVFSTGDILRNQIAQKTELGLQVAGIMRRGELVSDKQVTQMVLEKYDENGDHPVIFDGYPRTKVQAKSLLEHLKQLGRLEKFYVVALEIDDTLVVQRLSNRLVCSNKNCQAVYSLLFRPPVEPNICDECGGVLSRRPDDEPESVQERLRVYARHEKILMDFYRESGCQIKTLDVGEKTIPQAFWEFCSLMGIEEE